MNAITYKKLIKSMKNWPHYEFFGLKTYISVIHLRTL